MNLRAPVLDDRGWFAPFVELWTAEKLPWAETGAPRSYDTGPAVAEFQALMDAFAAEGARPGRG
ncbi:MAG TPA: hypothetical protein VEW25_11380 [Allosphingosinicella sp.]|nr:hypothetical protein [Allosphingosinicella sp.]